MSLGDTMSSEVTKVSYRFPIPALKGASNRVALDFCRRFLGEPSTLDEWDGEIHGFHYESLDYLKENPTEFKSFVQPVKVGNQWGLEVILGIVNLGHYNYIGFQCDVLEGKGLNLLPVFDALRELGISPDIYEQGKVYAYTWYNGTDEYITFE